MKKLTIFVVALAIALVIVLGTTEVSMACYNCGPGVGTPGYWMNHPEAWPVSGITIGGEYYTKAEAIALMKAPVKGDKTLTMFPALVAAKLNVEIGNCSWCIDGPLGSYNDALADAEAWMAEFPVGSGVKAKSDAWQYSHGESIYWELDRYNNGRWCADSRD